MNLTRRNSYLQKVLPSQNPPAGLSPNQVPQFVAWTFDDNGKSGCLGSGTIGGMQFIIDLFDSYKNNVGAGNIKTFDGNLPRGTFFAVGSYTGVNNPWENGCFVKKVGKLRMIKVMNWETIRIPILMGLNIRFLLTIGLQNNKNANRCFVLPLTLMKIKTL